ncbi:MAG: hypothetical protein L6U16_08860 [Porphyromonadaceae bacterium]|nr:MAG: hypothetical protein L6U16_08860 [Porphyromonadaceae bacterium]
MIFKNKGVERYELDGEVSVNPSFVDIQMGVAAHSGHIDFGSDRRIALGTSAVVGMEGAYFLNKHFGVGAQARLISTPAQIEGAAEGSTGVEIEDNQFNNASLAVGVYGNQALSRRISVGGEGTLWRAFCRRYSLCEPPVRRYRNLAGERRRSVQLCAGRELRMALPHQLRMETLRRP